MKTDVGATWEQKRSISCLSYNSPVEQRTRIDLTSVSFDEFVSFLFDRKASPKSEKWNPWYWHVEVECAPSRICTHYIHLFRQPEFLLERFIKARLEEGFWAIQGPNLSCSVYCVIHESDVPLREREECIRSMVDLFTRLFSREGLDSSVSMWWDSLCYDWHCGNRTRSRGGEDERLQDVFFDTLSTLLSIDSETCQGAALHGLGHLHHPATPQLIETYLQQHPSLTKEWKNYARSAAGFEVL
jgi:hypothetical protein